MKSLALSLLVAWTLLLVGCAPVDSLNPLITKEEARFEPGLIGTWEESSDAGQSKDRLMFSRAVPEDPQSREYNVTFSSGEKDRGLLGCLEGDLYLDLSSPAELNNQGMHTFREIYVTPAFHLIPQIVRLNDQLLLRLEADKAESADSDANGHLRIQVSPIHRFFKVEMDEKHLRLGYLDDEHLSKLLEEKRIFIPAMQNNDQALILTAPTDQLQSMVRQLSPDPEAFVWVDFERTEKK
jgi:hypothetical protein